MMVQKDEKSLGEDVPLLYKYHVLVLFPDPFFPSCSQIPTFIPQTLWCSV